MHPESVAIWAKGQKRATHREQYFDFAKQQKIGIRAEMCKRSFAFFVKEFWSDIENEPLIWNWHLDVFCFVVERVYQRVFDRLPKEFDVIVNVPPGTTKSKIFTVMAPVWAWVKDPTIKSINGSYSYDVSLEHADLSRDLVKSRRFLTYFPELQVRPDKNAKGSYQIMYRDESGVWKSGGSRYATSVGGTITGMHALIITVDDPLNPKKAASDVELKAANHWMEQTLSTRKVSKEITPTILVMQRLAEEDPSGIMIEKKKSGKKNIWHICLPGEIWNQKSKDLVSPPCLKLYYTDELLDTRRMNKPVLKEMNADLGQYGYAGQVGQAPSPPEGGMFKVDMIKIVDTIPASTLIQQVRYWDKAGTDKDINPGSAHTAGVKIAKLQPGYYWDYIILDVVRGQWEAEQRERIIKQTAQLDGHNVTIWLEQEPGSGGKESAQGTVRNLSGFTVYVENPTGDKVVRADPFSVQVNWGRIAMLAGPWNRDFIDEARLFPFGKWKDQIDAAAGGFNKMAVTGKRAGVWGR